MSFRERFAFQPPLWLMVIGVASPALGDPWIPQLFLTGCGEGGSVLQGGSSVLIWQRGLGFILILPFPPLQELAGAGRSSQPDPGVSA